MKKIFTYICFFLLLPCISLANQSKTLAYGRCNVFVVKTTDTYISIEGGGPIWITLEADTTGSSSGAEAEVYTCTSGTSDEDKCAFFYWDNNGDGTKTSQVLDGDASTFTRGVKMPAGRTMLKFTTLPSVDGEAEVIACTG